MSYIAWYTREYICANGVCEKVKYPVVLDGDKPARSGREVRRTIRRAEKNLAEAKSEAARSANENFRAGRDYFLTATFGPEALRRVAAVAGSEQPDALLVRARREYQNWVKRAKRKLPEGASLKYMAWVCDLDGKTGEMTAPHIHVIVNAEGMRAMAESWGKGFVFGTERKLYAAHHGDLTDLVEYLMAQSRQIGNEKRYIPSRNLSKPRATNPRPAKNPDARLRIPKGAALIWASEQRAGRPQKVRYYREGEDRGKQEGGEPDGRVHADHYGQVRAAAGRGGYGDRAGASGRREPERGA